MSGTSLDGVDLAYCTFQEEENSFKYQIGACETIPYTEKWHRRLQTLPGSTALDYAETHIEFGRLLGQLTFEFISKYKLDVDFVASHGHTIFHNPTKHYTSQIGDGAALAVTCGVPVICDFRSSDVAAGGQGAPLVPIGDELLFAPFDYCLNLGGFANISMNKYSRRIAFDISPVNIVLNYLASKKGKLYDKDGEMAASGMINQELLQTLNDLAYYRLVPPKSLGREWVEKEILPLFVHFNINQEDAARTFCEHVAIQIGRSVENDKSKKMLLTGGGTFNKYLLNCIAAHTSVQLIVPETEIINYKEALVFAFLGLLRMQGKPNCLSSVTGAVQNVTGGCIYLPR